MNFQKNISILAEWEMIRVMYGESSSRTPAASDIISCFCSAGHSTIQHLHLKAQLNFPKYLLNIYMEEALSVDNPYVLKDTSSKYNSHSMLFDLDLLNIF